MVIIPDAEKIRFKDQFIERYSRLTDWELFRTASLSFLERSFRVNTLKDKVANVKKSLKKKGWLLRPIPWCKEGFWLESSPEGRRDLGNLLEHHLGKIYVQEAASLIPPLVLKPKPGELVLDLCAAPGSKTTQMAAMMKNQGLIVANDISGERLQALGLNLQRCGVTNTIVTLGPGYRFQQGQFDRILVDAPCSATGTIMRSLKTIGMWNPGMIRHLSQIQKRLLETAYHNLKRKSTLVYSTCTMEPEEDEEVISWFLEKYPEAKLEPIHLSGLKRSSPVLAFDGKEYLPEIKHCLRIWPQDNNTEGFFVAKIKS